MVATWFWISLISFNQAFRSTSTLNKTLLKELLEINFFKTYSIVTTFVTPPLSADFHGLFRKSLVFRGNLRTNPPRFSYFPGKLNEKVVVTKDLATHEKNS
jgi:hypothetical protein